MRKFLLGISALVSLVGVLLSLIMFIMSIRFGELGRVLLYFVTLLISGEVLIICIMKLWGSRKDTA